MKNQSLIALSMVSLASLALASAAVFADEPVTNVVNGNTPSETKTEKHQQIKELKKQIHADKAKLHEDVKVSGKDSDAVKADREKLKEDRQEWKVIKAKKTSKKDAPVAPSTTQPAPQQ